MRAVSILLPACCILIVTLIGPAGISTPAQQKQNPRNTEQTSFDAEGPVDRPVPLSDPARKAIAGDVKLVKDLANKQLSAETVPQEWFAVSQIHLANRKETDLVVVGGGGLMGANFTRFWVLRQTSSGYDLVLSTGALHLDVLRTRTNGLTNIETNIVVGGGYADARDFAFDGHRYWVTKLSSTLIGAKVPVDLSAYKTREPLVQSASQDPTPLLAEARSWIWQQWQAKKPSYLKVVTHSKEGDETTIVYFVNTSETGDWQVMLQVHDVLVRREDLFTKRGDRLIENQLLVGAHVERIDPSEADSPAPHALSDQDEEPSTKYRLRFSDYGNRTVALL